MDSGLLTIILPACLAIFMAGLGLELTVQDFIRISKHPRAIATALLCQLFILVGIAFILCKVFALEPFLAVGMMLLAASPGGSTANLFSYLFKGDLALNISLTAINSVLAAFTLPFIVNFSLLYFVQDSQHIGLQFSKVLQVFAIILIPVALGMLLHHKAPKLAEKLSKIVRIGTIFFLILIIIAAIYKEYSHIHSYIVQVGAATAVFCLLSLTIGYCIPRLINISQAQARASAFEIGIHNAVLAMTLALTIIGNTTMAIPAAVYSIFMYIFAVLFGVLLNKFSPIKS